jgi:hypothetical protein
MKAHVEVNVGFHVFFTSVVAEGEWSAPRTGRFMTGERAPGTKEAGWIPEPVWTTFKEGKFCTYRDSNSEPSAVQLVASHYIEGAISTPLFLLF